VLLRGSGGVRRRISLQPGVTYRHVRASARAFSRIVLWNHRSCLTAKPLCQDRFTADRGNSPAAGPIPYLRFTAMACHSEGGRAIWHARCLPCDRVSRKLGYRVFAIVAAYFVTGGDKPVFEEYRKRRVYCGWSGFI